MTHTKGYTDTTVCGLPLADEANDFTSFIELVDCPDCRCGKLSEVVIVDVSRKLAALNVKLDAPALEGSALRQLQGVSRKSYLASLIAHKAMVQTLTA